jgi:hypothetical protein
LFESLYDLSEKAEVHFVGCVTEQARYDFSIIYTKHFFGKPLVICMQTGNSTLLCANDLKNPDSLKRTFRLRDLQAAEELRLLLTHRLPELEMGDQY